MKNLFWKSYLKKRFFQSKRYELKNLFWLKQKNKKLAFLSFKNSVNTPFYSKLKLTRFKFKRLHALGFLAFKKI